MAVFKWHLINLNLSKGCVQLDGGLAIWHRWINIVVSGWGRGNWGRTQVNLTALVQYYLFRIWDYFNNSWWIILSVAKFITAWKAVSSSSVTLSQPPHPHSSSCVLVASEQSKFNQVIFMLWVRPTVCLPVTEWKGGTDREQPQVLWSASSAGQRGSSRSLMAKGSLLANHRSG